jgi:hypothetical protein
LPLSFGPQYDAFAVGDTPCSGQRCQKQPSTKIATLALVKTMSALTLVALATIGIPTRNLRPTRWRADRNASSGLVSAFRFARITAEAPADVGSG